MKKENKMGVMPVGKLILTMSLPMMLSMLVQALYNVVDSIWVAKVSEDALTAVSLAFPVQNLMIGVATGTGVGINALLSRNLGAKSYEKVNKVAANGLFLAFCSALVFLLFGLFAVKPFFSTQIDVGSEIYNQGIGYLSVCCIFSFGIFGQITCERLMQATGKTVLSMISQLTGAIINLILDPFFILGIGPFPRLEAQGAAIATVIGQIGAFIIGITLNCTLNKEIKISFKKFKPDGQIISEIYKIGVPSIIMVAVGSLMNFLMNKILLSFTQTAAAVFGVYYKLQSFIFMPVFGLNNGVIPIIAYNYGAKQKERMKSAVRISTVFACTIMIFGTTLMWAIPETMLKLFEASDNMLSIGVPALRIISLSFPIAGFNICLSSVFQSLGKSNYSMFTSIARQLVVLIPVAYLLSLLNNVDYVWISFPIAEVVCAITTALFYSKINKNIISKLSDKN